jgi:hypothetical protein
MAWASCLRGGGDLRYGTWKYKQESAGECYALFLANLKIKIDTLPDVQIGMEKLTAVAHTDDKGKASINIDQVEFSAGWPVIARTLCHRMRARQVEDIYISTWRSKTHGYKAAPKGTKNTQAFLKQKAVDYCRAQGWSPANADEAEALCMLSYLRLLYEPDFAFERGRSHHQEALL